MARHSWEDPPSETEPSPIAESHAWEQAGYSDSNSEVEGEPPDPYTNAEAAAEQFLDDLVSLYLESTLSARVFCELCFWAAKSGMKGTKVSQYGMRPGQASGNYQKHLDHLFGMGEARARLYWTEVPASKKGTMDKTKM